MYQQSLFHIITKQYFNYLKLVLFVLSLLPFLVLSWQLYTNSMGINPLAYLTKITGHCSMLFLIITLMITPIKRIASQLMIYYHTQYGKRLSDWNWIIRLRRMFGLYSFFYALLHLLIYLWFDQGFEFEYIYEDIQDRPYIFLGVLGFVLLFLMAITSHNKMIKLLKTNWRRLHMSIYPLAIIVVVHYWWLSKPGVIEPVIYALIMFILLTYRVLTYTGLIKIRYGDTGMEVPDERPDLKVKNIQS